MKILFCIESSFERGMGHLFRSLNLADLLHKNNSNIVIRFYLNNDFTSAEKIRERGYTFSAVELSDSGWVREALKVFKPDIWINDRLDTSIELAHLIKTCVPKLITFDDRGAGAALADLNIAPLIFNEKLSGKRVIRGLAGLVLPASLRKHRKLRTKCERVLVSMGDQMITSSPLKFCAD